MNERAGAGEAPEPNALEARASTYLAARCEGLERPDKADTDALASTRRRAVGRAVASGVVSGAIIGGAEAWLRLGWRGGIEDLPFAEQWPYWAGFYAFVGVVTVIEMAFLYWNALDATARINAILGTPLGQDRRGEYLSLGLARAALEAPNPHHVVHGVDPYALMPRWRLVANNLLYKMKVGASSFVIRILMRRLVARAALRGFIPLLAIPLYAAWNAWITWRVIDEARLRALGPGAIDEAMRPIAERRRRLGGKARLALLHGVGRMVMLGYDAHPNYILLVQRLVGELEPEDGRIEVDWDDREAELASLDEEEATLLLDLLTLAAVLAGRPRTGQRRFLESVHRELGRAYDADRLKRLRKAFVGGRGTGEADRREAGR